MRVSEAIQKRTDSDIVAIALEHFAHVSYCVGGSVDTLRDVCVNRNVRYIRKHL